RLGGELVRVVRYVELGVRPRAQREGERPAADHEAPAAQLDLEHAHLGAHAVVLRAEVVLLQLGHGSFEPAEPRPRASVGVALPEAAPEPAHPRPGAGTRDDPTTAAAHEGLSLGPAPARSH